MTNKSEMTTQTCTGCGIEKPATPGFFYSTGISVRGFIKLRRKCIDCFKVVLQRNSCLYYKNHKDRHDASVVRWQKANRDHINQQQRIRYHKQKAKNVAGTQGTQVGHAPPKPRKRDC